MSSAQKLSSHPDIDRYAPKLLLWGTAAITGILALYELYNNIVVPALASSASPLEEADPTNAPQGQFSRKLKVHAKPIPVDQWPRNLEGMLIFQPTYDWQEVPDNCVCPPGLQYELNTQTGKRMARAMQNK